MMDKIRPYFGPVILMLLSWVVIRFPWIAAFFVSGIMLFVAFGWFSMVWRYQKVKKQMGGYQRNAQGDFEYSNGFSKSYNHFEDQIFSQGPPSLRNVSVTVIKNFGNK